MIVHSTDYMDSDPSRRMWGLCDDCGVVSTVTDTGDCYICDDCVEDARQAEMSAWTPDERDGTPDEWALEF